MNFMKVHPDTELWWARRDLCARCAHCKKEDTAMRCMATRNDLYCIDSRLLGAPCGPQAMLFVPKKDSAE